MISTLSQSWDRIESWLKKEDPTFSLPAGASELEIRSVEVSIGRELPQDVRESYLIHNGSDRAWLVEWGYLMPSTKPTHLSQRKQRLYQSVQDNWSAMREMLTKGLLPALPLAAELPAGIQTNWWSIDWVPFVYNECGDYLCVDLGPAKGGNKGQVINWWHEQGPTEILASSFGEWLWKVADELEQGFYRFDPATRSVKRLRE